MPVFTKKSSRVLYEGSKKGVSRDLGEGLSEGGDLLPKRTTKLRDGRRVNNWNINTELTTCRGTINYN